MRSVSSTCAGSPEPIRPATYLTSGEYATTRRSRARSSPRCPCSAATGPAARSLSRWFPGFLQSATRADGRSRTRSEGARTLPECRPGSSRWWRGRASPGSTRRSAPPSSRWVANEWRRAWGWAVRGQRRNPGRGLARPGAQPAAHVRGAERAARTSRGTARRAPHGPSSASAGRRGPDSARARARACSPTGTIRVLPPLPSTRTVSASKSSAVDVSSTSSSARRPEA